MDPWIHVYVVYVKDGDVFYAHHNSLFRILRDFENELDQRVGLSWSAAAPVRYEEPSNLKYK